MGQDAATTLTEIEATRAQLERDVDALFERLPEPAVMAAKAKTYGAAAGGAAVTVGLATLSARKRSARKARRREARINAEELARAFSPTPPPEPSSGGRGGLLLALGAVLGAVGAVVAMRRSD